METLLRDMKKFQLKCVKHNCNCAVALHLVSKKLRCLKSVICHLEKGWDWYVCEGFQHILYQQAEALQSLGVGPELKVSPFEFGC